MKKDTLDKIVNAFMVIWYICAGISMVVITVAMTAYIIHHW